MSAGELQLCDFDAAVDPALLMQVAELEGLAFQKPWGYESLRRTLAQPGSMLAVLRTSAAPLAFCLYQQVLDEASILQMATAPAARRCGHGLQLLGFVKQAAQSRGCVRLLLEVRQGNHAARSLYAAAGFAELAVRRGYYADDGEDALILACALASLG
jgi:ribosomal-protein-alanine N-acetyltransferase